ncbi:MAG: YdgA family protein, partial [Proteobacteria bacterium]|nr:YdgA family protein [Pseudomonadota bacterium]
MKKAIALVLVLTLLILGAYLGFGLLARKNYEMALAELQANFPGQIESSFKQGLFTSNLSITLDIPIPNSNPDTPDTIPTKISQTIHHGPFIFRNQGQNVSLFMPVQLYAHGVLEFEPFMANEPPFVTTLRQLATTEITVHAPIKGRSEVVFNGKPLQTTLAIGTENFNLNWQGFIGTLALEGTNLLTYDLDFRAPGLEVRGTSSNGFVIEGMTTQASMREGSHNLSLGTIISAMKNCEITLGSKPEEKIAMNGLNVRITSTEKDALLRVEEEISLNHLQVTDKMFGPGNLKISLTNLDAQAVAKLTEAYKALQTDPGKSEVMAVSILSSQASALLAKSP